MDASDEPLLQFKFRVQFYVETHLLLRYVFPSLPLHVITTPVCGITWVALIALITVYTHCHHHVYSTYCPVLSL